MAIEIKAPTFPESVADGTVATWHKQPGDAVKRDDLIVDIETDKVVLEVLATADGVLGAIVKNEGDTVLSDEVLGSIVEGGAAAAPAAAAPAAQAAAPAADGEDDPVAAPAARKIAEENGINIASVAGTGKGGRVTKEDVVAAVAAKKAAPAAVVCACDQGFLPPNCTDLSAMMNKVSSVLVVPVPSTSSDWIPPSKLTFIFYNPAINCA